MKKNFTHILLAGVVLLSSACKKDVLKQEETVPAPVEEVVAAPEVPYVAGFKFNTTRDVNLNIALRANNDEPLAGVVASVYLPTTDGTGEAIFKGVTDKNGMLKGKVSVAASVEQLIIDPGYIGLMRNAWVAIPASNTVNAVIGGKSGFSGDVMLNETAPQTATTSVSSKYGTLNTLYADYVYPGGYTNATAFNTTSPYTKALGRPMWLESTKDVISASMLSYINASLPEGNSLVNTHPAYLSSSALPTIKVTAKSDIYVTFLSEGAANQNTIAYYTYPTATPPTGGSGGSLTGNIDKITCVFPNASAYNSGGGLNSGEKVKLGNFEAGTSIGFIMIEKGWNTGGLINTVNTHYYTHSSFNPELNATLKQHMVTLYDDVNKVFLTGFEDTNRTLGGADHDFNDVVIYTTSSVAGAISTTGLPVVDKAGDADGDGVKDAQDAFPNDPARAYVSYYPALSTYGTVAFEDQWPKKGDYDMNDLVVSYRYTYEVNAQNLVVSLKADYILLAAGGNWLEGFGVQLPVAASAVSSVTGQKAISNYITMASNGVEAGQAKAVIIPFDNHSALLASGQSPFILNTVSTAPTIATTPVIVTVNFAAPIAMASLPISSFNPFLIPNLTRGREIHLAGYKPTDKADTKMFDTEDDATVPVNNKYYVSLEGQPWALQFSNRFSYPSEGRNINKTYMKYTDWALSSGANNNDWYSNLQSGYRNVVNIYSK